MSEYYVVTHVAYEGHNFYTYKKVKDALEKSEELLTDEFQMEEFVCIIKGEIIKGKLE